MLPRDARTRGFVARKTSTASYANIVNVCTTFTPPMTKPLIVCITLVTQILSEFFINHLSPLMVKSVLTVVIVISKIMSKTTITEVEPKWALP